MADEMSGDLLALSAMVDVLFSEVVETRTRLRALETVLADRQVVGVDEIVARQQTMDLGAMAETELSPDHEDFRRALQRLRDAIGEKEHEEQGQGDQ